MLLSLLRIQLVVVLTGTLLSGCISTTTPNTKFYVLNPLDSGISLVSKTECYGLLSLEVASLRLPQYLERPQIVTRSSENRLDLAEFHQWGGNLRKNMIRVLGKNLSQLLATPNITISPYHSSITSDFRIELEVMKFERDSDGLVRLSAQWRLSRGKDRKSMTTQITNLTSPTAKTGSDFEYTVSAMSELMGELSMIIGRAILKDFHGGSNP